MTKRIISFSVDPSVYAEYLELCKKHGIVMSKQVENFMAEMVRRMRK